MKLSVAKTPLLRSEKSTSKIMYELFFTLCAVWVVAIFVNAFNFGAIYGLRAFLIGLVSLLTSVVVDVLFSLKKVEKRDFKNIFNFILKNFSYITGLIYALCLPVGTPLYVVFIGALVSTLIGKYLFGGFGHNIFNPAAVGRIFVALAFSDKLRVPSLSSNGGYDLVTGGTITGEMNWTNSFLPEVYNYKDLLFGGYPSALGESFTILLFIIGAFLIIRGIVNYRLTGSYLITIILISLSLGICLKVDNVFLYVINQVCTGGIVFAAVFMISDPVTSPRSPYGKIIYGIGAGFLTMLIRINSSYPEGVIFSIAIMNMLVPLIDNAIKGRSNKDLEFRSMLIPAMLIWSMVISSAYSMTFTFNKNSEQQTQEEGVIDLSVNENQYLITRSDAKYGNITARVSVNRDDKTITKIEFLEIDKNEGKGLLKGEIGQEFYNTYINIETPIPYANIEAFTFSEVKCLDEDGNNLLETSGNGACQGVDSDLSTGATITSQAIMLILKDAVKHARKDFLVSGDGFYNDPQIKLLVTIDKDLEVIEKVKVIEMAEHEAYSKNSEFAKKYINFDTNLPFSVIDAFTFTSNECLDEEGNNVVGGSCVNITDSDLQTGSTVTNVSFILLLKQAISLARGE